MRKNNQINCFVEQRTRFHTFAKCNTEALGATRAVSFKPNRFEPTWSSCLDGPVVLMGVCASNQPSVSSIVYLAYYVGWWPQVYFLFDFEPLRCRVDAIRPE